MRLGHIRKMGGPGQKNAPEQRRMRKITTQGNLLSLKESRDDETLRQIGPSGKMQNWQRMTLYGAFIFCLIIMVQEEENLGQLYSFILERSESDSKLLKD